MLAHGEHPQFGPGKATTQLASLALRTGASQYLHVFKSALPHPTVREFAKALSHTTFNSILQLLLLNNTAQQYPSLAKRLYNTLRRSEATAGAGFTMAIDLIDAAPLSSRSQCVVPIKCICNYANHSNTGTYHTVQYHAQQYSKTLDTEQTIAHEYEQWHNQWAKRTHNEVLPKPQCSLRKHEVISEEIEPFIELLKSSADAKGGNAGKFKKIPQGHLTGQLWRYNVLQEYYKPITPPVGDMTGKSTIEYFQQFNGFQTAGLINSHLRTVTSIGLAKNGNTLWRLGIRTRDPFNRLVNNFKLNK